MDGYDYEEEEHNSQDVEPDKEEEEVAEAKVAYFSFYSAKYSQFQKAKPSCWHAKSAD